MDLLQKYSESENRIPVTPPQPGGASSYYPETPKIVQWVITYSGGRIKDRKQANYVLLGIAAAATLAALAVGFGKSGGGGPEQPSPMPVPADDPARINQPGY
ncbi:MAG: hypothetical protein HY617_01400 [Candidatus Sungbacteria bacterium]|nr:hypothetical protein [Candidatus Sungbacteria bacterium]